MFKIHFNSSRYELTFTRSNQKKQYLLPVWGQTVFHTIAMWFLRLLSKSCPMWKLRRISYGSKAEQLIGQPVYATQSKIEKLVANEFFDDIKASQKEFKEEIYQQILHRVLDSHRSDFTVDINALCQELHQRYFIAANPNHCKNLGKILSHIIHSSESQFGMKIENEQLEILSPDDKNARLFIEVDRQVQKGGLPITISVIDKDQLKMSHSEYHIKSIFNKNSWFFKELNRRGETLEEQLNSLYRTLVEIEFFQLSDAKSLLEPAKPIKINPIQEVPMRLNAHFVDLYGEKYIAVHQPEQADVISFWAMVLQQKPSVLVKLTNDQPSKKDLLYFPSKKNEKWEDPTTGFSVECVGIDRIDENIIQRSFVVKWQEEYHRFNQLDYCHWMDGSTPPRPDFELLLEKTTELHLRGNQGPILVHCGAGCGRTGTFISAHCAWRKYAKGESVDFYNVVSRLRAQRPGPMVETSEQYFFLHQFNLSTYNNRTLPTRNRVIDNDLSSELMDLYLSENDSNESIIKEFFSIPYPRDEEEAELNDVRIHFGNEGDATIGACKISLYGEKYIALAQPPFSESLLFWKMVLQQKPSVLVKLTQNRLTKKNKQFYFPVRKDEEWKDSKSGLVVKCLDVKRISEDIIQRSFNVKLGEEEYQINHLDYHTWRDFSLPSSEKGFEYLVAKATEFHKEKQGPILVHCGGGVGRTGTFIAAHIASQEYAKKHPVNFYEIVSDLREKRGKPMVETPEQYLFLHQLNLKDCQ